MENKSLKRRIIEISYKNKLSHIGSCLTAVDIIDEIYSIKKPDEKFVLSAGHSGLGLYVVLEKLGYGGAETFLSICGIHPDRYALEQNKINWASSRVMHSTFGIDCSSGSLGNGLPIAVGMALADRTKNVYCLISDGECSEGSIYEALNIVAQLQLNNLKIYCNSNGWGAYRKIDHLFLPERVNIRHNNMSDFPFLKGQEAHYKVMDENDYKEAMEILE